MVNYETIYESDSQNDKLTEYNLQGRVLRTLK